MKILALITLLALAGFAQTTAFTYQGKLTDAGNPANGNYDLQFKLYDSLSGGTQQGGTLTNPTVAVSAGVFTVTLDFGASVFGGSDRFLEIGVRPAGSGSAYTVLAPRQPIASTPYAIQTINAQQLGGLPAGGFVKNTTSQQAGTSFNISGNGTAGSLNINGPVSLGGIAPPALAPSGQVRIYFDASSNKVKVSENGAAFVNLVGASGISGTGSVNSIPLWSAGTTLGNSAITQSSSGIQLPNGVQLAVGAQGNQVQFGSPNSETGMTISGTSGKADLRFDGTLKLVVGPAGSIPAATNGIALDSSGDVGIGTVTPSSKLQVISTGFADAVAGQSNAGNGIYGFSSIDRGVYGIPQGTGTNAIGVEGLSNSGVGFGV